MLNETVWKAASVHVNEFVILSLMHNCMHTGSLTTPGRNSSDLSLPLFLTHTYKRYQSHWWVCIGGTFILMMQLTIKAHLHPQFELWDTFRISGVPFLHLLPHFTIGEATCMLQLIYSIRCVRKSCGNGEVRLCHETEVLGPSPVLDLGLEVGTWNNYLFSSLLIEKAWSESL